MKPYSLNTCWGELKRLCTYLPFLLNPSLSYTHCPAFKVTLWNDLMYPLYDTGGVNQPSRFQITVTFSILGQKVTYEECNSLLRFCQCKISTLKCYILKYMFYQVILSSNSEFQQIICLERCMKPLRPPRDYYFRQHTLYWNNLLNK